MRTIFGEASVSDIDELIENRSSAYKKDKYLRRMELLKERKKALVIEEEPIE